MPNDLIQHRMNQYWQDVCYTEKFMSQCRKNRTANRLVTVHNVLCRCPSDGQECLQIGNMKGCLENYEFSHFKSLGREMPIIRTTFSDRYHDRHYYCPCPPDPCASKAFYNQCREHETKNMHGVDVAEAEVMLHPKGYPSNYSETAKLIGLPEISCLCPPRFATSVNAAYSSSGR